MKRRNNKLNSISNFIYTENQYYHIEPKNLISLNNNCDHSSCGMSKKERKELINEAKKEAIKGIGAGDNIKLTNTSDDSVTINVRLSSNYNEKSRHIDSENTPLKDENLDEVTRKLFNAIDVNGDTIDGERIKINGNNANNEFII